MMNTKNKNMSRRSNINIFSLVNGMKKNSQIFAITIKKAEMAPPKAITDNCTAGSSASLSLYISGAL